MTKLSKALLIATGTLFVVLAVLGMLLPVLPTTPFLLLAAWCYARSSERFYHWLMTNRWFGEYIRNYHEGLGMAFRQKILTLLLLWLTIANTVCFVVTALWLKITLIVIAAGVTLHLITIKTYRPPVVEEGDVKD
ncbi:YbaN family protein [candidate division KSB1 bacterium]|nr:YbaN family protein [candidate division KSB1 bacterium]